MDDDEYPCYDEELEEEDDCLDHCDICGRWFYPVDMSDDCICILCETGGEDDGG